MKSDDVGESYLDSGSQTTVKNSFINLTNKYIKNKILKTKYQKVVEWSVNEIEQKIRTTLINNQSNMDSEFKENATIIRAISMAVKQCFNKEITAAIGAYILNFSYDDKKSAYHSFPVTWQKKYGYNHSFDTVFRIASNMDKEDVRFTYNNYDYKLWLWKGDYWNLGTGSEIGLYKRSKDSAAHYDAVDFEVPMQISTYKYSKGNVYGSYFNWDPVNDKQWWITAFDWKHKNPNKKNLLTIGKINLSSKEKMASSVVAGIERGDYNFDDIILSNNDNTIWIIWK